MTDRHTLVLEIDPSSLRAMAQAGSRTIVAKHCGDRKLVVAWLAWEPSARDTVVWEESYGLFAAGTAQDGVALRLLAVVDHAIDGALYPFSGSGFGRPQLRANIPPGHYEIQNDAPFALTFGLVQAAAINGRLRRSPMHAVGVGPGNPVDFAPMTTISVWTEGGVEIGSIVRVPPYATTITFHAARRVERCLYDPDGRRFVPAVRRRSLESERRPRPPLEWARRTPTTCMALRKRGKSCLGKLVSTSSRWRNSATTAAAAPALR